MSYKDKQKQLEVMRKWRERNPNYFREWRERNPNYFKEYDKLHSRDRIEYFRKYYRQKFGLNKNKEKHDSEYYYLRKKANQIIFVELRAGRMKRLPCSVCGCEKSEAHHPNYSKPLEVIWLCKKHHEKEHHKISTFNT